MPRKVLGGEEATTLREEAEVELDCDTELKLSKGRSVGYKLSNKKF